MLKLTRLLYDACEVEKSFIISMIDKMEINECYYWLFELYYSKLDIVHIIWELYLDYYSVLNPKMENYIIKRLKMWEKDNSIEHICYIIKNLHVLSISNDVFILRQLCKQDDLHVTKINERRGRPPTWTKKYKKEHIALLTSVKKRQFNNICYYINVLLETGDGEALYKDLILYYATEQGYNEDNEDNEDNEERKSELLKIIKKNWEEKVKNNCLHYLLAIICQMNVADDDIQEQKIYIVPNKKDIEEIKRRYDDDNDVPAYKILSKKRCYNIDKKIGIFGDLPRFKFSSQNQYRCEILMHWEYYAYKTPFWREIIDKYGGSINEEMRTVEFKDDSMDLFYNLYGYELDEQPLYLQNMSLDCIDYIHYLGVNNENNNLFVTSIEYPENFTLFK